MAISENLAENEIKQLLLEKEDLLSRLSEAEETLNAIHNGDVDAIVVSGKGGEQVFSLQSAETPYRKILEEMNEGAVIVSKEGLILYCNRWFSEFVRSPQERITGSDLSFFISIDDRKWFKKLLHKSLKNRTRGVVSIIASGNTVHAQLSFIALSSDMAGDICIVVSDVTEIRDYQDFLQGMVDKGTADLEESNRRLEEKIGILKRQGDSLKASTKKYRLLYNRLRESEEKYKQLVESANSIIMKADSNGFITFMNSFGLRFFGYTADEIIGRHVIGTTIPERDSTGGDLTELTEAVYKNPDGFLVNEHENLRKDGTLAWVSWTNRAIKSRDGNLVGILAIGNDISAFKKTEKALYESEEKYRKIVETSAEGIVTTDTTGRYTYVNNRMAQMLGFTGEELIGKSAVDFTFGNDEKIILELRKAAKKGNLHGEVKFRRKDGSILWTYFSASALHDNNGTYIGNLGMLTDITERKKSEDELFKSEERFRTAFEKGAIPMALASMSGEFFRVNIALCNLTGYSENELKGMKFANLTHPDDLENNLKGFKKIVEGETSFFRMEKRYIRKNGEIIWVDMSTAPVSDSNGNLDYMVTYIQEIDKRKIAETRMVESEKKYKELVENSRSIILRQDSSGRFTFFNEYAQAFFGFTEEEIIGKTAIETIVPEYDSSGKRMVELLENIYEDPDKFKVNINENVKKNGERIWVEWYNKSTLDNEGKHTGHIAIGFDVTDRHNAEKSLRESEEKYRLLFERMGEAFALHEIIIDEKGIPYDYRFLSVNPSFERLTGLKADETIGKRVLEVLPGTEKYWIDQFGAVAVSGIPREFESFSSELNRYYKVSAFCPAIGRFAVIFEDITDRRLAEIQLRKSGEKLEIALNCGHIGIWEKNLKSGEATLDERMGRIMGIEPAPGGFVKTVFEEYIHEEDLPHFRKAIERSLESDSQLETVFRVRSDKEVPRYVSTRAVISRDENGDPVSITGVCFDVTAVRKGAEKVIISLNEELLRSNKELESFAYVASHDLQEPLRMVSSFTQMLEKRYADKLDQDAKEYIRFAVDGAKRMYELINGLLSYSRVQTKGKQFVIVDMNSVFDKVKRNLNLMISERNAALTEEDLPVLYADESQMIQLVQNLAENGIKFSPASPRVHFSASDEADHYLFSVRDEGMGIDPQYFERIFKIFQRLMPKEEYGGTGIGLAVCRRIVERHRGKIWVESEPGKGSTFFFTIPKE
jgi:PAS domain S-box-containing protein